MFSIEIESPNQQQNHTNVVIPCTIGRYSDAVNPSLFIDDPFVSRLHLRICEDEGGTLLVECVGRSPIRLSSGTKLQSGEKSSVNLPVEITVGHSRVRIDRVNMTMSVLRAPHSSADVSPLKMPQLIATTAVPQVTTEQLIDWFESLISLQGHAIGRQNSFAQAAKAVVDMIGLDRCVALSRIGTTWKVEAQHGELIGNETLFSQSVVERVLSLGKTIFDQSVDLAGTQSLAGVSAFIGSPIVDSDGMVCGCLFGSRQIDITKHDDGVRPIQAQLVQVVAGIVGSRLARLEAEAEQTRTQVQLEQFASPALVREMQHNPQWLEAQNRELTMLFGDIRDFSSLSERLPATDLYSFVRDTMDCLTQVIMDHGGFVFNYAGDGIAAMWNAPGASSTHAKDACNAALDMQACLTEVDKVWADKIGGPVRVGLGVHTGKALVGNSGSKARLHYSPLGKAVNLASRLEGATKYLGVDSLISESTRRMLGQDSGDQHRENDYATRNLGEIAVVGIDQPIRVHELALKPSTHWENYELLRQSFEAGDLEKARAIGEQLSCVDDFPTLSLLKRIHDSDDSHDSVWQLSTK